MWIKLPIALNEIILGQFPDFSELIPVTEWFLYCRTDLLHASFDTGLDFINFIVCCDDFTDWLEEKNKEYSAFITITGVLMIGNISRSAY